MEYPKIEPSLKSEYDFKNSILSLSKRAYDIKSALKTEEATKTALVLPFLHILGYDIFNPYEILPEYICDLGIKKGEKIDYVILKDEQPIILIECKSCSSTLDNCCNQLLRYYHATNARFAILTNGIRYHFYADLNIPNKMDEVPFLSIDILSIQDNDIIQLQKFRKQSFEKDHLLSEAKKLKLVNSIQQIIKKEFTTPSPEFVRFFIRELNNGRSSIKEIEIYTPIVKDCIDSYLSELKPKELNKQLSEDTTELFFDKKSHKAFHIIREILSKKINSNRIKLIEYKSYDVVSLDGTWRWICRIYSKSNMYLSFPSKQAREDKYLILHLNDIYTYSDQLINSLDNLLSDN